MICCITILITYIVIFGLLTYYFIKKRTVWNELFSINNIIDTLVEIFACPEHFIIYIPGIIFENTSCVNKKRIKNETKDKIRIILTKINNIFKKINDIDIETSENINTIKQVKWVLEGTIDNFNHMYEETAEFYNNLSGSYSVLTNTKTNTNTNLITLEKLILLEQNIEYCDSILKLLELIYTRYDIDNNDYTDFETLFHMENNYMICLIYNLIENVRLYKIKMYTIINF